MAFFIKNNSSGSWYTIDGKATIHEGEDTIPAEITRHGYSSESEANSAISSLSLTNVTVVEE